VVSGAWGERTPPSPLSIEIRNGLKQKTLRDLIRFESNKQMPVNQRAADSVDFSDSSMRSGDRCSTILVASA
jgi:hypothetical protein